MATCLELQFNALYFVSALMSYLSSGKWVSFCSKLQLEPCSSCFVICHRPLSKGYPSTRSWPLAWTLLCNDRQLSSQFAVLPITVSFSIHLFGQANILFELCVYLLTQSITCYHYCIGCAALVSIYRCDGTHSP